MHALDMDMVVDSTFGDAKLAENMRANSYNSEMKIKESRTMLPVSDGKLGEINNLLQFNENIEAEKKPSKIGGIGTEKRGAQT